MTSASRRRVSTVVLNSSDPKDSVLNFHFFGTFNATICLVLAKSVITDKRKDVVLPGSLMSNVFYQNFCLQNRTACLSVYTTSVAVY